MQTYLPVHLENIQTHTFTTRTVDEEVDQFQKGRVSVCLIGLNPIINHWLQRERTHTHSLKLPQLNLLSYTHSLHRKHTLQLGLDIITNPHTHHWFTWWYIRALCNRVYEWIQCKRSECIWRCSAHVGTCVALLPNLTISNKLRFSMSFSWWWPFTRPLTSDPFNFSPRVFFPFWTQMVKSKENSIKHASIYSISVFL